MNAVTWITIISALVSIELAIGHGTIVLTDAIPDKWVASVKAWCNILAFVGSTMVAVLSRSIAAIAAVIVMLVASSSSDVRAADLPVPVKLPALAPAAKAVDLTNWSGFYVGAGIGGINQGADVITGGILSLNSGGTTIGFNVGYLSVTPQYLLGGELGVDYQTVMGVPAVNDGNRWVANVEVMAGGSLNGLFGTVQAPPNGGPFNLGTLFASAMPYAFMEPRIGSRTQTGGGVGIFVPLKGNVFLRGEYEYAPPQNGQGALQYPRIKLGWAF